MMAMGAAMVLVLLGRVEDGRAPRRLLQGMSMVVLLGWRRRLLRLRLLLRLLLLLLLLLMLLLLLLLLLRWWLLCRVAVVLVVSGHVISMLGLRLRLGLGLLVCMSDLALIVDMVVSDSVVARQCVVDTWVPPEQTALDGRRILTGNNL
jgi:hypothetical protein